jgi:hypothetical protein
VLQERVHHLLEATPAITHLVAAEAPFQSVRKAQT